MNDKPAKPSALNPYRDAIVLGVGIIIGLLLFWFFSRFSFMSFVVVIIIFLIGIRLGYGWGGEDKPGRQQP